MKEKKSSEELKGDEAGTENKPYKKPHYEKFDKLNKIGLGMPDTQIH